jgi:tetratricopeptide (TPR) repeat protein
VSFFHESIKRYEPLLESDDKKLAAIKGISRARTNLGAAYENKGDFDKAQENNEQVIQQVSQLVEQFEKDEQPSDKAALIRLLGSAYINQGTLLTRTRRPGKRQDAIKSFNHSIDWSKKLVDLFPDDPQNQNALGMAHSNLGMTYRAMMEFPGKIQIGIRKGN